MGRHGFFRVTPIDEDRRKVDRATVRRVVDTFRPYKGKVGLVGLMIGVTSGLGVINPLMIVLIFDKALFGSNGVCQGRPCPNLPLLYLYVAIMIAVPIVTSIIGIGQTYLTNLVGLNVMQDIRNRLYEHLQGMPLRFFTTTRTGEIQSRLANDVGGVQSVVTDTASTVLSNVVTIISTIIAMIVISIPLTILSLLLMPLFLWLTVKVGKARREVATNTQRTLADMTTITEETLSVSGILLSKSFGRQRFEIGRFRERERAPDRLPAPADDDRPVVLRAGRHVLLDHTRPRVPGRRLGELERRLRRDPVRHVGRVHDAAIPAVLPDRLDAPGLDRGAVLARALRSDLRIPGPATRDPRRARRGGARERDRSRALARRAVPLRGPSRGDPRLPDAPPLGDDDPVAREWTLEDVDLDIRPGQLAALVGPSGAGKTTVTYLVPRLYDVQEGAVRSTASTSGRSSSSRSVKRSGS